MFQLAPAALLSRFGVFSSTRPCRNQDLRDRNETVLRRQPPLSIRAADAYPMWFAACINDLTSRTGYGDPTTSSRLIQTARSLQDDGTTRHSGLPPPRASSISRSMDFRHSRFICKFESQKQKLNYLVVSRYLGKVDMDQTLCVASYNHSQLHASTLGCVDSP